jgi:hypothetical protein
VPTVTPELTLTAVRNLAAEREPDILESIATTIASFASGLRAHECVGDRSRSRLGLAQRLPPAAADQPRGRQRIVLLRLSGRRWGAYYGPTGADTNAKKLGALPPVLICLPCPTHQLLIASSRTLITGNPRQFDSPNVQTTAS